MPLQIQQYTNFSLQWFLVLLIIVCAIYLALKVKNEFKSYNKKKKIIQLSKYQFYVPHWWNEKKRSHPNRVEFKSKSAQDVWYSSVEINELLNNKTKRTELLNKEIENLGIILDEGAIDYSNRLPSNYFENNLDKSFSFIFKEGMGTENETRRVYLQIALIENNNDPNHYLMATNLNPVLDGGVEGPYFEELIKSIKFNFKHAL